jgi:hypothetical protein
MTTIFVAFVNYAYTLKTMFRPVAAGMFVLEIINSLAASISSNLNEHPLLLV